MFELAIMWDWLGFAVRWTHVITAVAWIGSSFYFIALDLGLDRSRALESGADGEEWQVHGGGFYHIQKFLVAPARLPEHLTWFKWESYSTWLSGAALLMIVYWAAGDLFLLQADSGLALWQGIAISAATLAGGWLLYDLACRSPLGDRPTLLMVLLFAGLVALAWALSGVFTGRAMMLHLGAVTATIMSANVFFVIIPNQRIVVADLRAGRGPDPIYGKIAKLRSTHNNYLTLPVLFFMLSNHYPLAFATRWNWIIAALVFFIGVLIRHFFNTMHARKGRPWWTWAVAAGLFIVMMWLSTAPALRIDAQAAPIRADEAALMQDEAFAEVANLVRGRCSMCHAQEPVWDGLRWAPQGVLLETDAQIARQAREIYLQAGASHAMPPANITWMEEAERSLIVDWYRRAGEVF